MALSWNIIEQVAKEIDVEPCALRAVYTVESRGEGFFQCNKPIILFEGHIFWRHLKKHGKNVQLLAQQFPNIVYSTWTKQFYGSQEQEYRRLEIAKSICIESALCATSYGLFQILGQNYTLCGCDSVFDFVKKQSQSEEVQLNMFIHFLCNTNTLISLKDKDWESFARRYNGIGYKKNMYHIKLANAYERCLNKTCKSK